MSDSTRAVEMKGSAENWIILTDDRAVPPTDAGRIILFGGNPDADWFRDCIGPGNCLLTNLIPADSLILEP